MFDFYDMAELTQELVESVSLHHWTVEEVVDREIDNLHLFLEAENLRLLQEGGDN